MKLGDEPGFIGHVHSRVQGKHDYIGIIYKSSFCLSKSGLRLLYYVYVLVFPYLQYCITVWGSTYPSNLNRIVLIQKRVITVISKEAFNDPNFSEIMYFEIYRCLHT